MSWPTAFVAVCFMLFVLVAYIVHKATQEAERVNSKRARQRAAETDRFGNN